MFSCVPESSSSPDPQQGAEVILTASPCTSSAPGRVPEQIPASLQTGTSPLWKRGFLLSWPAQEAYLMARSLSASQKDRRWHTHTWAEPFPLHTCGGCDQYNDLSENWRRLRVPLLHSELCLWSLVWSPGKMLTSAPSFIICKTEIAVFVSDLRLASKSEADSVCQEGQKQHSATLQAVPVGSRHLGTGAGE